MIPANIVKKKQKQNIKIKKKKKHARSVRCWFIKMCSLLLSGGHTWKLQLDIIFLKLKILRVELLPIPELISDVFTSKKLSK